MPLKAEALKLPTKLLVEQEWRIYPPVSIPEQQAHLIFCEAQLAAQLGWRFDGQGIGRIRFAPQKSRGDIEGT